MASKVFLTQSVPKLYAKSVEQNTNLNTTIYYSSNNASEDEKREEVHEDFLQRFEELCCQMQALRTEQQQFTNEVCHYMLDQTSFNESLTKEIQHQETLSNDNIAEKQQQNELIKNLRADLVDTKNQQMNFSNKLNELNVTTQQIMNNIGNNKYTISQVSNQLQQQNDTIQDLKKKKKISHKDTCQEDLLEKLKQVHSELAAKISEQQKNDQDLRLKDQEHENNYLQLTEQLNQQEKATQELASKDQQHHDNYSQLAEQLSEQIQITKELRKRLDVKGHSDLITKNPFVEVFRSLPPNYPIDHLFINGMSVNVTHFVNISNETDIAHFADQSQLKTIDCNKIDGVSWGSIENDAEHLHD